MQAGPGTVEVQRGFQRAIIAQSNTRLPDIRGLVFDTQEQKPHLLFTEYLDEIDRLRDANAHALLVQFRANLLRRHQVAINRNAKLRGFVLINFARRLSAFLPLAIRAATCCATVIASVITASPATVGAQGVRGKSFVERREIKHTIQFIQARRTTDCVRESDVVDS